MIVTLQHVAGQWYGTSCWNILYTFPSFCELSYSENHSVAIVGRMWFVSEICFSVGWWGDDACYCRAEDSSIGRLSWHWGQHGPNLGDWELPIGAGLLFSLLLCSCLSSSPVLTGLLLLSGTRRSVILFTYYSFLKVWRYDGRCFSLNLFLLNCSVLEIPLVQGTCQREPVVISLYDVSGIITFFWWSWVLCASSVANLWKRCYYRKTWN